MANTMKALQTVTVGAGGVATVTFSNIPPTYTDLIVKGSARLGTTGIIARFNSDSGANYSWTRLTGNGSGVAANNNATYGSPYNSMVYWSMHSYTTETANTFSNGEMYIANYVGNNNSKSVSIDSVSENNGTEAYAAITAANWNSTAVVNSITLTPDGGGNFAQYSTFTVYGVFNQDVTSIPIAPTIGTATAGIESASVAFTPVSGAASYTATSTPGGFTATGTSSPLVVTGLNGGTSYTFTVAANNPFGSNTSVSSNSITAGYAAYESIASTTVGAGGTSSIVFNSIPSVYTHLQLRFVGRSLASAANDSILIRYNSDSGTNYVIHRLYSDTGSVGAQGFLSQTYTIAGDMPAATASLTNTVGSSVVDILDYSNTNKNKTTRILSGRDENGIGYNWTNSSLWLNTAAISSITVLAGNGSLAQFSRASLYGIKGA